MTDAISSTLANLNAAGTRQTSNSFSTLDQSDFLRLLTVQLQQQDPLEPVENKEMLAQMAQFSGLAGTNETNARLADMSAQLQELINAQRS
ncbi:flagellar hook assembly protein FlgD [Erythrobacter sp. W53]|uniref:flagellar hook assembly protein FlgD n=1 Tax=Erythrobacteraceae TaxID=335929 RepID=UPI0036D2D261